MFVGIRGWSLPGEPAAAYETSLVSNPYPAFRACENLPRDARLLLVCEPRGFLLPRPFETSSQHDRPALAGLLESESSTEAVARELRRQGFTHLLVNVSEMRRLGGAYPVLPWTSVAGQRRFVELTRSFGKPVILEEEVVVFSLDGSDPGPASAP